MYNHLFRGYQDVPQKKSNITFPQHPCLTTWASSRHPSTKQFQGGWNRLTLGFFWENPAFKTQQGKYIVDYTYKKHMKQWIDEICWFLLVRPFVGLKVMGSIFFDKQLINPPFHMWKDRCILFQQSGCSAVHSSLVFQVCLTSIKANVWRSRVKVYIYNVYTYIYIYHL